MEYAITFDHVSKKFPRTTIPLGYTTVKSSLVHWLRGNERTRKQFIEAVNDVSFSVARGGTLGIVGRNGSGKSTVLKIAAGIYRPDSGRVHVRGRIASLIELGAGFHPAFSGRENILINGLILGMDRKEIQKRMDAIVEFAELREVIDEPVRTYSTGMYMRLGFAIAAHTEPDVLLIDEVLAVGDESFRQKCKERIAGFHRQGKTLVLVSHDLVTVEEWCDEVVWLDAGAVRDQGDPSRVINRYQTEMTSGKAEPQTLDETVKPEDSVPPTPQRWGSQEVEIVRVAMRDSTGQERYRYETEEEVTVEIHYRRHREVDDIVFGIGIFREDGLCCYGTNTAIDGMEVPLLKEKGEIVCHLSRLGLLEGTYFLDVALHRPDGSAYDYRSRHCAFSVQSPVKDMGVSRLKHRWSFS